MNNRLYVGNLTFSTTEETIREAFQQFGEVTEVKLMLDRDSGQSRGFCFVTMADPQAATKALTLSGQMLDGRALRVDEAQERSGPRSNGGGSSRGGGGGRR